MAEFIEMRGNGADAITGERIFPRERVFDTGVKNRRAPYGNNTRTRLVKEDTIVWLAEQAGYTLTKRNAGDSGDAKSVDTANVESGDGAVEAGKAEAGGSKPAKRRSSGVSKSK